MSPVKEPVCTTDCPRTRIDAAFIRAEILHPDSFYPGTFLDEEDAAMRNRAENVSHYKLPTYQAAAVVVRVVYSIPILHVMLIRFFSSPRSPLSLLE
jgi:hypothetical protein